MANEIYRCIYETCKYHSLYLSKCICSLLQVPTKPTKAPSLHGRPTERPVLTQPPRRPTPTFSPTITRSDPTLVLHLSFDKIEENRIIDDSKFGNDASLTTGNRL